MEVSDEDVAALARVAGLTIDPAHLPGVRMNLSVLLGQAALFLDPPMPPIIEPAPVYRP